MGATTLSQRHEAVALAEHLLSPGRARPAVVVTIADQAPAPYLDVTGVVEAVGDLCDVYLVPTGELTWVISQLLPDGGQVYGGAARVYPVDQAWIRDPYSAPLRLAYDAGEGLRATQKLIGDALRYAGSGSVSSARPLAREVGIAVVSGIVPPNRVMLELDDGRPCVLWCETVVPGCDADQLVVVGMRLEGRYDPVGRRFDVSRGALRAPGEAVSTYAVGQVVLVRVAETLADRADAELVPGLRANLHRDDVTDNPIDRMTSLMTVGEVLAARIVRIGVPGGRPWRLSMLDIDDDEPIQAAPSLLHGGPSWLRPEHVGVVQSDSEGSRAAQPPTPAAPVAVPKPGPPGARPDPARPGQTGARPDPPVSPTVPTSGPPGGIPDPAEPTAVPEVGQQSPAPRAGGGVTADQLLGRLREAESRISQLELLTERLRVDLVRVANRAERGAPAAAAEAATDVEAVRHERDSLQATARAQEQELSQLRSEAAEGKTQLRTARQETQQLRKQARSAHTGAGQAEFTDPEQQFRWEVEKAWTSRIPAGEKDRLPLRAYVLGPDFLATLDSLEGVDRDKVADVVVDIATGRIHDVAGRETHQMRVSDRAGSDFRTRQDGATCWRVSLQVKTPGARRLHFWQPPGGAPPELSSVRHHDDMRS